MLSDEARDEIGYFDQRIDQASRNSRHVARVLIKLRYIGEQHGQRFRAGPVLQRIDPSHRIIIVDPAPDTVHRVRGKDDHPSSGQCLDSATGNVPRPGSQYG